MSHPCRTIVVRIVEVGPSVAGEAPADCLHQPSTVR